MRKPGRNDPCPCGSGKKHKKCCGVDNVIAFDAALYEKKFTDAHEQLSDYAIAHFQEALVERTREYVKSYTEQASEDDINSYVALISAWIVFNDPIARGQTIFEHFYTQKSQMIKNPTVRKTVARWGSNAQASVFEIISRDDAAKEMSTLKDVYTGQTYKRVETEGSVGTCVIGVLIPTIDSSVFFLSSLLFPEESNAYLRQLGDDLEVDAVDPNDVFPAFLADAMQLDGDEPFTWLNPRHEMVATLYADHMYSKGFEEEYIQIGVGIWNMYCGQNNPIIQKPSLHAAALDYFVQVSFMDYTTVTQGELAKEYGTSAASISNHYSKFYETMELAGFTPDDEIDTRRTLEQDMHNIQRLIEEQDFESDEEVTEFVQGLLEDGNIPQAPKRPRDIAQDLLVEAHNAHGTKQKQLIEKALDIYPNSPDAYVLLAERSGSVHEQRSLLQQALTAGEQDLGKEFFLENKGHFWGLIETRPYMRAKASYALLLEETDALDEAITMYEELLVLNPNDNQGIRDMLLPLYIETEKFMQARHLMHTFEGDMSASFLFSKAIIEYTSNGLTKQAMRLLEEADEANPHVIDYLLGNKRLPEESPAYIGVGDEREAIAYVQENFHLWEEDFLYAYLDQT